MQVTCQTVDGKIAQTDILEAELKVNIEAAMPERGGSVSMVPPLSHCVAGPAAAEAPLARGARCEITGLGSESIHNGKRCVLMVPEASGSWQVPPSAQEGRCKAAWKREFKLPWREAGPLNHHDDIVDSDQ